MRARNLGDRLRAILLATPFVGGVACNGAPPSLCPGGCGPCPTITRVAAISFQPDFDAGCVTPCQERTEVYDVSSCGFLTLPDSGLAVTCTGESQCHTGRRPASLLAGGSASAASIGRYFAAAARLEAAAVEAFEILACELAAHHAPTHLATAARRSAREEMSHAESTGAFARRFGEQPLRASFTERPQPRTLVEIAIENAREGCAGETYGALIAAWQACHAADPDTRRLMRSIADDELSHARLAFEVAEWLQPRLPRAERQLVRDAQDSALDALAKNASRELPAELVTIAGLPRPDSAAQLVAGLQSEFGG